LLWAARGAEFHQHRTTYFGCLRWQEIHGPHEPCRGPTAQHRVVCYFQAKELVVRTEADLLPRKHLKTSREEKLIKVSVLYPNGSGCKFDMNYYLSQHMPMVQQKLGPACRRMAVEEGIAGGAPGAPATYVAMGHLYFDSTDAFQAAFGPHAQAIMADIPNYTNIQPTIQISEVKM
jgi:uncharacterized protein (TIGR02118 family)